eukprot:1246493-Pleurochrysis_carterae.AAC.1
MFPVKLTCMPPAAYACGGAAAARKAVTGVACTYAQLGGADKNGCAGTGGADSVGRGGGGTLGVFATVG